MDYNLDGAAGIEVISHGPAGVASFLVYFKYDGAKIFVKNKDGVFTPAAFTDKNQAAAMKYFNTAVCDYDHDNKIEILYADKNIVRIYDVNLSEAKVFQKNQININSSDFNAQCMYAGQGMIYAYDPDSKRLFEYNVEKRHSKIGAAEKKIDDASLSVLNGRPVIMDYTALNVFASHPELVFDKMNVGDYEDIKNGRYNNLAAKDINGDGSADIILTCGAQNYLDIFGFKNDKFDHSMRFKIFNTKQFSQFSSYTAEPQKIAAADFDGDSYNDLVMLVHNKVIIYFSDSPSKPGAAVKSVKGGN